VGGELLVAKFDGELVGIGKEDALHDESDSLEGKFILMAGTLLGLRP
jgi:hypothetical protein